MCFYVQEYLKQPFFKDNIVQNYISVCFTIAVQLHYGMKGIC